MQDTREDSYTIRSVKLQTATWKQVMRPLNPYMLHLRALKPGFMLELGCGTGRNLGYLRGKGVGVDHYPTSVTYCQSLGYTAYTTEEFKSSPYSSERPFDSLLKSHLLEHMNHQNRLDLIKNYLHLVKPYGKVIMITPLEKGQASDQSHIELVGFEQQAALANAFRLTKMKSYSFPFMRFMGPYWIYNEFVSV